MGLARVAIALLVAMIALLIAGSIVQNDRVVKLLDSLPVRFLLVLLVLLATLAIALIVYFHVWLPNPRRFVLNSYMLFFGFVTFICKILFGWPQLQSLNASGRVGLGRGDATLDAQGRFAAKLAQLDADTVSIAVWAIVVVMLASLAHGVLYWAVTAWEDGYDPITRRPRVIAPRAADSRPA